MFPIDKKTLFNKSFQIFLCWVPTIYLIISIFLDFNKKTQTLGWSIILIINIINILFAFRNAIKTSEKLILILTFISLIWFLYYIT